MQKVVIIGAGPSGLLLAHYLLQRQKYRVEIYERRPDPRLVDASRRGMMKSQETGVTGARIKADVPLSEMFGYIGDLRTMTSGRGQFSMSFSHYAPCPNNIAEEVIKEAKERQAAA